MSEQENETAEYRTRYLARRAREELAAHRERCCSHGVLYVYCRTCPDPESTEVCKRHDTEYVVAAGCPGCRDEKELT